MRLMEMIDDWEEDGPGIPDKPVPFDWNGRTIVWRNDLYAISVDDIHDARYVAVWAKDRKIGQLTTRGKQLPGYLAIDSAQLDKRHQGQRLGYLMYKHLLKYLSPRYRGISTYLPDQVNVKQVPRIWKSLGGYSPEGQSTHMVVDR